MKFVVESHTSMRSSKLQFRYFPSISTFSSFFLGVLLPPHTFHTSFLSRQRYEQEFVPGPWRRLKSSILFYGIIFDLLAVPFFLKKEKFVSFHSRAMKQQFSGRRRLRSSLASGCIPTCPTIISSDPVPTRRNTVTITWFTSAPRNSIEQQYCLAELERSKASQ